MPDKKLKIGHLYKMRSGVVVEPIFLSPGKGVLCTVVSNPGLSNSVGTELFFYGVDDLDWVYQGRVHTHTAVWFKQPNGKVHCALLTEESIETWAARRPSLKLLKTETMTYMDKADD